MTFRGLFFLLTIAFFGALPVIAQDLTADAIIAKHLDSIGPKEKRDEVKNRIALGTSSFESKLPAKKTGGKALIASDASNLYFLASLASKEYPFEKIGYFNSKISLPFVIAGARSPLGAFLADHEKILSDGLFGGSISNNWILLNWQKGRGVVKATGTKKIDGKRAYGVEYFPKWVGTTEFSIRMYFDAETFQHVRTEYIHKISPKEDTFGQLGRQGGTEISMTEKFADFRDEGGLILPHSYTVDYVTQSNSGTGEFIWGITIAQYRYNQNLASDFFSFDGQ